MAAVNAVPVVGRPVAFGTGFIALVVVGLSRVVGQYFATFAHEGGHMLAGFVVLRRLLGYTIDDDTSALTVHQNVPWSLGNLFISFAGYATPPLLGLGAAALVAGGNPWAVLFIAFLFSALALVPARNGLAFVIPLLVGSGIVWAEVTGPPSLLAALAAGIAWFLLLAGVNDAFTLPSNRGDAATLAASTVLIPGFVWKLIWIIIAVVSLYAGGRLLLVPGA